MRKIIIGIDGFDGSGKTTLCNALLASSKENGLSARLVGRDAQTGDDSTSHITDIIKLSDSKDPALLSTRANFYLRLARAAQRLHICNTSPQDVLILDRFLINDLSMLPPKARPEYCTAFIKLCGSFRILSIDIRGEFSVLWDRVQQRPELSPKELAGESFNRALFSSYIDTRLDDRVPFRTLRLDAMERTDEQVARVWQSLSSM